MDTIEIRPIRKNELMEATNIFMRSMNDFYEDKWTKKDAISYLKYYYSSQKDLFLVALNDNKIVGGIMSVIPGWRKELLADTELFVANKFHKLGIGKKLLRIHLNLAKQKYKIKKCFFLADKTQDFPLKWYERIGMKKTPWLYLKGNINKIIKGIKY